MGVDRNNKVTNPKTKANPAPKQRADNKEWKESSPLSGSGQSWSTWAKQNPNREANAKDRQKEFKEMPTTMTKAGTTKREEMVQKWKDARPVSGKGGAKSDEDKEKKRQSMIAWAKANPNKGTNANRVVKEARAQRAAAAKPKKAAPKGKKK